MKVIDEVKLRLGVKLRFGVKLRLGVKLVLGVSNNKGEIIVRVKLEKG